MIRMSCYVTKPGNGRGESKRLHYVRLAALESAQASDTGKAAAAHSLQGRAVAGHGPGLWPAMRQNGLAFKFLQVSVPSGRCPWPPCQAAAGCPRSRTYSGQRRCATCMMTTFAHVRGHMEVQAGAYCKTVGSAYSGQGLGWC